VAPLPEAGLNDLKRTLDDPVEYFMGGTLNALTLPGSEGEFYGIPPRKQYIFEPIDSLHVESSGFAPLFSHARGGLAEAWTGGVYPLNDAELADFPFDYSDIEPYYERVADRIGISGEADDLARFMPVHAHLQEPLELDDHSAALLQRYRSVRTRLNNSLGCYLGRSRIATLSRELEDRQPCAYLGRCIWGCPVAALYTPAMALAACERYPTFEYLDGHYAERFRFDEGRRVYAVTVRSLTGGERRDLPVEVLALAAGAIPSSRIFLQSVLDGLGEQWSLCGLMDNRQVLMPFVNLSRLAAAYSPASYQYHQLSLGLDVRDPEEYVHGQITTLTTAQAHPILQTMPLDFPAAIRLFRNTRGALGLLNLNFHDRRRPDCTLQLEPPVGEDISKLGVSYVPDPLQESFMRQALKRARKALRRLGCVVAPGTVHVRPMGSSVHYSGTLPMASENAPCTTSAEGRSHDFENLYLVDGSTFPFLPAKNLTFTLMANAARIADRAF
jgi:choline dehydrogenase-like flavoprotein